MKRKWIYALMIIAFMSCNSEEEHVAIPIAPIIKEVTMPSESESLPNSIVKIKGKGFTSSNIIRLIFSSVLSIGLGVSSLFS